MCLAAKRDGCDTTGTCICPGQSIERFINISVGTAATLEGKGGLYNAVFAGYVYVFTVMGVTLSHYKF